MEDKKMCFAKFGRTVLFLTGLIVAVGLSVLFNSAQAGVCNHDDKNVKVTKSPTCGSTGMREYYCSKCGQFIRRQTIPATGNHVYGDWKTVQNANCTNGGVKRRYCKNCSAYESKNISPWGHNSNGTKTVNPTCTEDGYTAKTCTNCGAIMSRTVKTKLGHDWGEWETKTKPTCQKTGQRYHSCKRCGAGATETMDKISHDTKGGTKTVKETCAKDGYSVATCSMCHAEQGSRTVIKANGNHTWGSWIVNKNPTCKEYGSRHHICEVCGITVSENTAPIAHDTKGAVKTVAATCVKDGYTVATCSMCHTEQGSKTVIPATGNHTWGKWTEVQPAYCKKTGTKQRACEVCGKTESGIIDALEHDVQGQKKTVPATCVSEGYEVVICSRCHEEMQGRTIIPKNNNHDWGAWEVKTANTCEEDGLQSRVCKLCGKNEEERLPKLGHDGQGQVVTVPATCVNDGYQVTKCSRCGAHLGEPLVLPANGNHSYDEWVVISPLTCETDGYKFRVCKVCGHCDEVAERKTGHLFEGQIRLINGRYVVVCTNCGKEGSEIKFNRANSKTGTTPGSVANQRDMRVQGTVYYQGNVYTPGDDIDFWRVSERYYKWLCDCLSQRAVFNVAGYQGHLHYNVIGNTKAGTNWVKVSIQENGDNTAVVTIVVADNTTAETRKAEVYVFDDLGNRFVFSIGQLANDDEIIKVQMGDASSLVVDKDATLIIDPGSMKISSDEFVGEVKILNATGTTILVDYEDGTKDWITVKRVWDDAENRFTHAFTISVKKNTGYFRYGKIRFTDTTTGQYGWLVINQDPDPNMEKEKPKPVEDKEFRIGSCEAAIGFEDDTGEYAGKRAVFRRIIVPSDGGVVKVRIEGDVQGELHWDVVSGDKDLVHIERDGNCIIISVKADPNPGNGHGVGVIIRDDAGNSVGVGIVVEPDIGQPKKSRPNT